MNKSKTKTARKVKGRPSHEDLIREYANDLTIQGLSRVTIDNRVYALRQFCEFVESQGLHIFDVDKDVLRSYIEDLKKRRGLTGKSVRVYLTHVSGFFDYLTFMELIDINPLLSVKKRYQNIYKDFESHTHKIISVEEMAALIRSAVDIRDRCMLAVFAKTGVRRGELIAMDAGDINFGDQTITLKITAKRSNRIVYFDDETDMLLRRWLRAREVRNKKNCPALFIGRTGNRLEKIGIDRVVGGHAEKLGLHDPRSENLEDHFTSHCFRHWFTTYLIRAGMPRDFVKELRGDSRREAIDVYNHIDRKELRESYLAHIPQLGI